MPVLTPRALIIMVTLSLLMGVSIFWSPLLYVALAGFALTGSLCMADHYTAPRPDDFELKRKVAPRLSLGDENEVKLTLYNRRRQRTRGTVGDHVPPQFQKRDALFSFRLDGGDKQDFMYTVTPHQRGSFRFEGASLQVKGMTGMLNRIWRLPLEQETKVYPSYLQIRKYQLQTRRSNIDITGRKKQRRYGEGREFESLREYTRDDEYRKVNWKATARMGKPIVSQFQIERNQNVILLVDTGRMMRTRAGEMTKLDHAVNAALMLSFICVNKEDNVGLLVFGAKVHSFLPPKRGRSQLSMINEVLYKAAHEMEEPDYHEAVRFLRRKVSRRSLVLLVTDIVDDRASGMLIREFASLYPQHLPLCITVKDKTLVSTALRTPENETEMLEMGVAQTLLEERMKALRFLRLNGVLTLDTDSDNLTADAINKYVEVKSRSLI